MSAEPAGTRGAVSNRAMPSTAMVITLLALMMGFQPLATDLYLSSLPHLGRHFSASPAQVQWTLSVFIAGFAGAQLAAGPLSDRFGRLPVVIGGCLLYIVGSLAGALGTSLAMVVAARLLQALGTCCAVVCARAIVRDLYDPVDGARVLARAFTWMAIAVIGGPIAGGLLQTAWGWRSTFAALVIAGVAVLVIVLRRLPETNRHPDPTATHARPLLDNYRRIFRSPVFRAYAAAGTATYCGVFAYISGSSFVLIGVFGVTPAVFGICFSISALGYLVGSLLLPRLSARIGLPATTSAASLLSMTAGVVLVALALAGWRHPAVVVVPMFFFLIAHGLIQPVCQSGAVGPFPRQAGAAAALLGFLMAVTASLLGLALGRAQDGTSVPTTVAIASCAVMVAVSVFALVRPVQAEAHARAARDAGEAVR